ncbi:PatB family C-S lyase [Mycoplasmatota bacterium WC44]
MNWFKYFDETESRNDTFSIKWRGYENTDIIPLTVADMDLPTAPAIVEAMTMRVGHPMYGYSLRTFDPKYNDSILSWWKKRRNIDLKTNWIIYTPGIISAITYAIIEFSNEGDGVVIQTPVYDMFKKTINILERKVVDNPLVFDGENYSIDFLDLEEKLKIAKLMILCSPHNPLGICWSKSDLEKVYALCMKYNVLLISDEAHSDLIYNKEDFISLLEIDKFDYKNIIITTSIGKTFNCSGLQIANNIIPDIEIRKRFKHTVYWKFHAVMSSQMANAAVVSAYNEGEEYLDNLVEYLKRNRDYINNFIVNKLPNIKWSNPSATYLGWIDCSCLGLKGRELEKFMLESAKIKINPGDNYGDDSGQFIRLNFAMKYEIIVEVMDRIYKAVSSL